MSSKVELQRKLKEIGYEIGPFASKETLSNVMRLHTLTDEDKGINVAKLSDHDLRKSLVENGLSVGPVTNHTRSIYQRKLLETLTNETTEGQEDIVEIELPTSTTPPTRATRSSIHRTEDNVVSSSPARSILSELPEPRIPLNRVEIDDRNSRNLSAYYPNVTSSKSKTEETITNTYSSQRSSTKPEPRNSGVSYGLRNPYDFQNDEPVIIRHEHKATPFRTANLGADEAFPTSSSRLGKPIDVQTLARNDFNEIRSRIFPTANESKEQNVVSKKSTFTSEPEMKKPVQQYESKSDVAVAKNGSTFLYGGITVGVALIVFVLYLYFGE